jgi:hypothetical protein
MESYNFNLVYHLTNNNDYFIHFKQLNNLKIPNMIYPLNNYDNKHIKINALPKIKTLHYNDPYHSQR